MLSKFTDPYERKARLFPAFLVILPIFMCAVADVLAYQRLLPVLVGLAGAFGGLYLAASVVREYGKRLESRMILKWGGLPSTQLLRHRDSTIDNVTKTRYHAFLGKHLSVSFPSLAEEENDTANADAVYQSGVRWLLEKTRDTKTFSLLFKENIAYGFRRNCMAVRGAGMLVCVLSLIYIATSLGIVGAWYIDPQAIGDIHIGEMAATIVIILLLMAWTFFFNEETLRTSAVTYAKTLLAACDVLPKKR